MIGRLFVAGAVLLVSSAAYADCRPMFRFNAGRDGRGLVQNVAPGEPCRISVYRSPRGSSNAELQSAQLVKAPGQGTVRFEGTSAIYTPSASFNGRDRMMVRYNYVAADGRAMKSDISYRFRP